jgi:pyridoxal phosphate enzyme (YggS family)
LPDTLEGRYQLVCDRMSKAATKAGRKGSDVILVAVTKFADAEQIRGLLNLGHRDFGENRAQTLLQHAAIVEEAMARLRMMPSMRRAADTGSSLFAPSVDLKQATPGANGVRWHMIGHLQRNKAKKVAEIVRLVHSVDSLRLAEELQSIALDNDTMIEILLQVNCSGEGQKFGCPLPAAIPLAEQIGTMLNLRLRGLMTMAPLTANPEEARPSFARCRELFEEMKTIRFTDAPFNILSMGMSGDFEVAIEEGANVVRVGSAIFGESAAQPHEPAEASDADDAE